MAFSQESPRAKYTAYFDSIAGTGDQSVFNGLQFVDIYRSDREDFRYFKLPGYQKGDILYVGQDYYNLDMKYDLVDDRVIVMSKGELNFLDIQLIREKVEHFQIQNHNFVFYNASEVLEAGFYEEAYKDEDNVLLVKYIKSPRERFKNKAVEFSFKEDISFFIIAGDTTREIDNPRDVKRLFKDKSAILKSYASNSVEEKKNFRLYLVNVLKYLKRNK